MPYLSSEVWLVSGPILVRSSQCNALLKAAPTNFSAYCVFCTCLSTTFSSNGATLTLAEADAMSVALTDIYGYAEAETSRWYARSSGARPTPRERLELEYGWEVDVGCGRGQGTSLPSSLRSRHPLYADCEFGMSNAPRTARRRLRTESAWSSDRGRGPMGGRSAACPTGARGFGHKADSWRTDVVSACAAVNSAFGDAGRENVQRTGIRRDRGHANSECL